MTARQTPSSAERALLERLRDIRASQTVSGAGIRELRLRVSGMDKEFGAIRTRLSGLEGRINILDQRLSGVEARLGPLQAGQDLPNVAMRHGAPVIQSRGHDV